MIPNKIYIEQKAVMYDMVNTEPCKPDDYEYISKDAMLEWAKEKAEDYKGTANIRRSFEMMIRKIESL